MKNYRIPKQRKRCEVCRHFLDTIFGAYCTQGVKKVVMPHRCKAKLVPYGYDPGWHKSWDKFRSWAAGRIIEKRGICDLWEVKK